MARRVGQVRAALSHQRGAGSGCEGGAVGVEDGSIRAGLEGVMAEIRERMVLTPQGARLLLFMLGHGGSRIRPNGDYPASETMEMERKLKEVAGGQE